MILIYWENISLQDYFYHRVIHLGYRYHKYISTKFEQLNELLRLILPKPNSTLGNPDDFLYLDH